MRSKRSKAWHRRKDDIARARRLIEQGSNPPYGALSHDVAAYLTRKLARQMATTRELVALRVFMATSGNTIKFRRYKP